jgi:hypothetical protein
MKADLITKINTELSREIVSEGQVVYILVECRKLLELEGALDSYPSLRLCMDWALHPVLDRKNAKVILGHFDAYETEFRKSGITIAEFGLRELNDFLSLDSFRNEFIAAMASLGVDVELLKSDQFWRGLIQHYCEVIRDCPLRATDDGTRIVLEVTALPWPVEMASGIFLGRRVVQWNWKPRDRDRQKDICALV